MVFLMSFWKQREQLQVYRVFRCKAGNLIVMQSFWNCDMKRHYQENTTCCKILNSLGNPDMSNWDHTKEEKKKCHHQNQLCSVHIWQKKKISLGFLCRFLRRKRNCMEIMRTNSKILNSSRNHNLHNYRIRNNTLACNCSGKRSCEW